MNIIRTISYFIVFLTCLVLGFIGLNSKNTNNTQIIPEKEINILCTMSNEEKDETDTLVSNKETKVLLILKNDVITNNILTETYTYLSEEKYTEEKTNLSLSPSESYTFVDETYIIKNTSSLDISIFENINKDETNIKSTLISLGYTCN